jgi:hypothetical protein
MRMFAAFAGLALLFAILWDAFETIVLPRRITRHYRLARLFYRSTWEPWRRIALRYPDKRRESLLSFFGPISFLMLLLLWAVAIMFAFSLLHYGFGSRLEGDGPTTFWTCLYFSGTSLFTLGLGDVRPIGFAARLLTIAEAGTGFGFLALVIGYFPVLYQSFSRREVHISLLDAHAGSPPTAVELLHRSLRAGPEKLNDQLVAWEIWCAELMESHLSYPVLCYFRSQHDNTSWLAVLAVVMDTAALIIANTEGETRHQAEMTFAMARHAIVDLSQTFMQAPIQRSYDRFDETSLAVIRTLFNEHGLPLRASEAACADRLRELRAMYEPYVQSLGSYILMTIPPFQREKRPDNWQTSAWGRITAKLDVNEIADDDHL